MIVDLSLTGLSLRLWRQPICPNLRLCGREHTELLPSTPRPHTPQLATMASMNMVELVPTGQVAKELATQVVRVMTHTGATEEAKARVQDFIAQCKERVRSRDAPGFVSTVLTSAADDLFNFPKRRGRWPSLVRRVVGVWVCSRLTLACVVLCAFLPVLEDVFSVLVSMLNNASRTSDVSSTLDQLCEVVTSSTTGQTESRLLMYVVSRVPFVLVSFLRLTHALRCVVLFSLGTAFNMFSSAAVRFKLFLEVTRYAAKTNQLNLVKPYFSDAAGWADTWELDIAERRQLYTVIATVLEEDGDLYVVVLSCAVGVVLCVFSSVDVLCVRVCMRGHAA